MEKWKVISNTNYEISNKGQVRNSKTGRILKPHQISPNGYFIIHLSINGVTCQKYIHKLVAENFCEKDNSEKTHVNHIDEDKTNNSASNLEWVTQKENIRKYWDNHPEASTWNKGLTKYTDERVAKAAKTLSETHNKKKQMV